MVAVAQGQASSGLDVFVRIQTTLTDPSSGPTYVIKEPAGTTIGTGSGFRRSIGHYDARDTVIPSGFDITSQWTIEWLASSATNIQSSGTESFTVTSSFNFGFAEVIPEATSITDSVKLDLGLTDEYTSAEYNSFIDKAVKRVNRRLCFTGTSNRMTFNADTGLITPTPNDTVLDILILQIECFVVTLDRKTAVGKGIRVKDGETEIDTTASFGGFDDQVKAVCEELKDAVSDYLKKQDKESFSDVVSENAEVIWYGNTNIREDLLHSGQGSNTRYSTSPYECTINM